MPFDASIPCQVLIRRRSGNEAVLGRSKYRFSKRVERLLCGWPTECHQKGFHHGNKHFSILFSVSLLCSNSKSAMGSTLRGS